MAQAYYSILGQVQPAAATATDLYTVGVTKQSIISTIAVCNQAATAASFNIAVRKNGTSLTSYQYIAYQVTIAANDTTSLTWGITLNAGDVITVQASTANVSFSVFGQEIY